MGEPLAVALAARAFSEIEEVTAAAIIGLVERAEAGALRAIDIAMEAQAIAKTTVRRTRFECDKGEIERRQNRVAGISEHRLRALQGKPRRGG